MEKKSVTFKILGQNIKKKKKKKKKKKSVRVNIFIKNHHLGEREFAIPNQSFH